MPKRGRSFSNYARVQSASAMGRARGARAGWKSKKKRRTLTRRKNFSLNVHKFSRYTEAATVEFASQGLNTDFEFKFSDLINYTEFSSLFDQFQIDKVVIKFQLITNPDGIQSTDPQTSGINSSNIQPTNWYPKLWYIRDYDGGAGETLTSIKERQGVKFFILRPNQEYSIKLSPAVAVQTYKTLTTTGYGPKRMMLDMANGVSVPHYGVKTVFDTLGLNPLDAYPFKLRWEAKYYFTCKDVR